MIFKIGDKIRVVSKTETYYDWEGYIEDSYTLYSSQYAKDVIMYDVRFEYSYICDSKSETESISRKFREEQIEIDKEWMREQKLKSLGL